MAKTDCLLIHVPQVRGFSKKDFKLFINYIAIGVFSMCNELAKNKFKPQIIHLGVEKSFDADFDIADYVKKNKIKMVGLSLHWHYQAYDTLNVARKIKEINPDTFIFLGGIMSSAFADDIIKKYSYIDAVIKGEGEKSIVELAQKIHSQDKNLSSVSNLRWRKNGKIVKNKKIWFANEEELNSYSFDALKYLKNYERYLKFPFIYNYNAEKPDEINYRKKSSFVCCLGRGCPGNCSWCGGGYEAMKKITGRNCVTLRNPKIAAKEFINFKKKYNLDEYYFCFDPFPKNQQYLIELFEILGKEMPNKIDIMFECFGLPTKEFIDSFKKNLGKDSQIIISPEFASEELRKEHRAFWFSNQELFDCLEYLIKKEVKTLLYFSVLPFESDEDKKATKELINKIMIDKRSEFVEAINQQINDIEPYCPLALNAEKYGITLRLKTLEDYINNSKGHRDLL